MSLNITVHSILASHPVPHPFGKLTIQSYSPPPHHPPQGPRYKNEIPPNDDGHHSRTKFSFRRPLSTLNLTPRNFTPSSPTLLVLPSILLVFVHDLVTIHRDG